MSRLKELADVIVLRRAAFVILASGLSVQKVGLANEPFGFKRYCNVVLSQSLLTS